MQIEVAKNNLKPKPESWQEFSWPKIQKEQNNEVQVDMTLASPEIQVKALNSNKCLCGTFMYMYNLYFVNIYKYIYFLYLILSGKHHCQPHFLDEDTCTKITGIPQQSQSSRAGSLTPESQLFTISSTTSHIGIRYSQDVQRISATRAFYVPHQSTTVAQYSQTENSQETSVCRIFHLTYTTNLGMTQ